MRLGRFQIAPVLIHDQTPPAISAKLYDDIMLPQQAVRRFLDQTNLIRIDNNFFY